MRRVLPSLRLRFAALLLLLAPHMLLAQILPGTAAAKAAPVAAVDPYGRETPRGLANGLIGALAAQDYERAGHYFDLSAISAPRRDAIGAQEAKRLQAALDQGGSLDPFLQLSADPAGRIDDMLPGDQEQIGSLPPAKGVAVPLIATATQQNGIRIWRISSQSIAALAAVSPDDGERDALHDKLPPFLTDTTIGGAPLSDWLILIVAALVFYVGVRTGFEIVLRAIGRVERDRDASVLWRLIRAASVPLSVNIAMVLFLQTTRTLQVAIVARQLVSRFAGAILLLSLAAFLWRLADVITDLIALKMERTQRRRAHSILIFVRRALKLLLLAFGTVAALNSLGINVTTGIAALGLGGLAIALGAQKTVENIVGSISVIIDEPVRVGDFCRVGDVVGTVEEIGIRSTRIRTNERTRVTIPNGNFAALQIENYTLRDRYLFAPRLLLTYDLDADGVQRVLDAVRAALGSATCLLPGARATLADLTATAIAIDVFCWIDVPDFTDSLFLRETLLLDIMRRVEAAGGAFASTTSSIRIETAPPPA